MSIDLNNTNQKRKRSHYSVFVYSKKRVVFRLLNILLVVFILIDILQLIQKHPNETILSGDMVRASEGKIHTTHLSFIRVFYQSGKSIFLEAKQRIGKLASSVSQVSDRSNYGQKGLIKREISKKQSLTSSVKICIQASYDRIALLQHQALVSIMGYLPYSWALFWWGMVWGGNLELPEQIRTTFKIIGMQHVVVASGYNVGLVVGLGQVPTSRFSRFYKLVILCALIFLYVTLTDRSAAVIRAGLSAGLRIGTQLGLQRQMSPLRSLWLTVVLMVFVKPDFVSSLSFQLSVAATLGIQWWFQPPSLTDPVTHHKKQSRKHTLIELAANTVVESFWGTFAAQLLTLPLILYHFGQFNGWSLVTNSLLLWCTPLLTQTGLFFSVALMVTNSIPFLAQTIAFCASLVALPLLALFLGGAEILARFPLAVWSDLEVSWWFPLLWAGIVVAGLYLRKKLLLRTQQQGHQLPLDILLGDSR